MRNTLLWPGGRELFIRRLNGSARPKNVVAAFRVLKHTGLFLLCAWILTSTTVLGQAGGGGMKYGPKYQSYVDSIKNSNYKWIFPIFGKRLAKKGFDMQYPVGIMLNTYSGSQKMNITDLKVGFNDHEPVPMDFIKFGEVKAYVQSITVRPDLWLFPFMDIYGIGGVTYAQTNVNVVEPVGFSTQATFNGSTFGVGSTFAGGFHRVILIVDCNHTWSTLDRIAGTIQTTMLSVRPGMSFLFPNDPKKSIAFWVGTTGFFVNRTTEGTINLNDLRGDGISDENLQRIIDGTAAWYQGLSPIQQATVKYIAQSLQDKIQGRPDKDVIISYSLVKKPTSNWSMMTGAQMQFSHRWQVRTELGFLGGRSSLLLSGNYRFRW